MYKLAISRTLKLRSECARIENNLSRSSNLPNQFDEINFQLQELQSVIGENARDGEDVRQNLLEVSSGYCQENKIKLMEIPIASITNTNGYQVLTNQVILQGDFKALLGFIHRMEHEWHIARVMSAKFHLEKDLRQHMYYLHLNVCVQNINTIKDENN